jgi:hypothetical protein
MYLNMSKLHNFIRSPDISGRYSQPFLEFLNLTSSACGPIQENLPGITHSASSHVADFLNKQGMLFYLLHGNGVSEKLKEYKAISKILGIHVQNRVRF